MFVYPSKCKGIVSHAAASLFAYLAYSILWEKNGDTQTEYHMQNIKSLFSSSLNLDRILFASDRGYWNRELINYILKHGEDALGTVKRSYWFHYTRNHYMCKNNLRKLLEEKGPSTLHAAKTTIIDRNLTRYAYRTGTKKISLTMATIFEGVMRDCVVKTIAKNKNNENEQDNDNTKKAHTFRLFRKGKYSDYSKEQLVFNALKNIPTCHITERQGSSEWFKCRAFSFT